MVPTPKAVKVKTSDGWQDIAIVGPQGPPSGQMVLIQEILLSAGQVSMDFQNIPQIFSHLMLMGDCEQVGGATGIRMRFNGDSGNSYYYAEQYNTGSTPAASAVGTAQSGGRVAVAMGVATANGCSVSIEVPGYRNGMSKQWMSRCSFWETTNMAGRWYAGSWRSTAAINRITIYTENGSAFATGTRLSLYGIKAEPESIRQNWNNSSMRLFNCASGPNSAGAWAKMKMSSASSSMIDPPTDFTVNADDSVTITNAGWYDLAASVMNYADVNAQWLMCSISTIATPGDGDIANGGANSVYARASCSGHVYLNAGQKVYVHAAAQLASTGLRIYDFSISRAGVGPPGVGTTPGFQTVSTDKFAPAAKAPDAAMLGGQLPSDWSRDWAWSPLQNNSTDYIHDLANTLSKFGMTRFDGATYAEGHWEYYMAGYVSGGADYWMTMVPNNGHAAGVTVSDGSYWDGTVHAWNGSNSGQSLGIFHTNWNADAFCVARGEIFMQAGNSIAIHNGTFLCKPSGLGYAMSCKVGGFCAITGPVTTMRWYSAPRGFYGQYGIRPMSL